MMIISVSVITIISFFFDGVARRTNIPAVLLLIGLGVGIQHLLVYMGIKIPDFSPALEILGILGLIMIVLEAALDLKLGREKLGVIARSFFVAVLGLGVSIYSASIILTYMIPELTVSQSVLYATPLSILSSAIIIPSVESLSNDKREFHLYESAFSVIIGILLFYFLIQYFENQVDILNGIADRNPVGKFTLSLTITIIIAIVASYILLIAFQKMRDEAKLLVLISVLMLLYSIAKIFDLSSLIIILGFGLIVGNPKLFFSGPFKKFLHPRKFQEMKLGLHILTEESTFIVMTFFFVIFGSGIMISSLYDLHVLKVSLLLLASIFIIRFVLLRIFIGRDISPQVWIAPRGLITILLFYAIPPFFQSDLFDSGILLFIIISTGILMTFGLILNSITDHDDEESKHVQLPETAYTVSIDPSKSRIRRWLIKLENSYKKRFLYPIIRISGYHKLVKAWKIFFSRSAKALGIKPIFTNESKFLKQRLRTVMGLIKNPDDITPEQKKDYTALKRYVHNVIFETNTLEGMLFDIFIFVLIILSVGVVMIQSVGGIPPFWSRILFAFEVAITIIFSIEYILRLWTTSDSKKYAFSTFGIVDLLAILPLFLEMIFANISSLGIVRLLRLLRIFRVLKLARYLGEANALTQGIKVNSGKITVFLFFVLIVSTIMGAVMFVVEGPENGFTSIPRGIYWAVVTLTTVGYGDISPGTPVGQFISMIIMILGYGVIAVPTGLVAAGVIQAVKEGNKQDRKCPKCKSRDNSADSNYCRICGTEFKELE